MRELLLIKFMNIVHSKGVCRVRVHNNSVFGINLEPCSVAHKVSRKLACEFSAIRIAPKKLCCCAVLRNADNAKIVFRVFLHIFEILACACNNKNLADKLRCVKARGDCSDYIIKVEILRNLVFIKQITDVSAVSLIPTETVHISRCVAHFLDERCC